MDIIDGIIVDGMKSASQNLEWQMPYFLEVFPEIKNCYLGSINVKLQQPSKRLLTPDFETHPIKWHHIHKDLEEKFSFTRIRFEAIGLSNNQLVDAWIYDPHNSPHRLNPFQVEIIARKIEIGDNKLCRIYLDK